MSRTIPLTRGEFALVDDDDYERLSQWRWHYLKIGYAARSASKRAPGGKRAILMHREILPDAPEVDHISGDKLDNRRSNLRPCTHTQNCQNVRRRSHNRSGYKGVWKHSQVDRYYAGIKVDGIHISLGGYATAIEAAAAYNDAALRYFGEFAQLNDIDRTESTTVSGRDLRADNTTGFRGVSRHRTRWHAAIAMGGQRTYLGSFSSPEEAARAWDDAALRLQGAKAKLNFPTPKGKDA